MVVINSKILVTWFLAAVLLATHVCDPVECPISCQCFSLSLRGSALHLILLPVKEIDCIAII